MKTWTGLKLMKDLGDKSKEDTCNVTQKERGGKQEGSWRHD